MTLTVRVNRPLHVSVLYCIKQQSHSLNIRRISTSGESRTFIGDEVVTVLIVNKSFTGVKYPINTAVHCCHLVDSDHTLLIQFHTSCCGCRAKCLISLSRDGGTLVTVPSRLYTLHSQDPRLQASVSDAAPPRRIGTSAAHTALPSCGRTLA